MVMIPKEIDGRDDRGGNLPVEAKWGKRAKSKKELVKSRTCAAQMQLFQNAAVDRVAWTPSGIAAVNRCATQKQRRRLKPLPGVA
jgi:hypothetical protein